MRCDLFFVIFHLLIGLTAIYIIFLNHQDHITTPHKSNNHSQYAFATITTPAFCMGAIALGHTLHKYHGSKYDRLCLVTKDVNSTWRRILKQWWRVEEVDEAKPRKHYRRSWIKLWLWGFEEYEKIVYLDTDTLVFANIEKLFKEKELSCVYDSASPQICNTGVLVLKPNIETMQKMFSLSKIDQMILPPGDQGFINAFFKEFNPLPAEYNALRTQQTSFGHFFHSGKIKIVHFICKKPWKCGREGVSYCGCGYPSLNEIWYQTFDEACEEKECMETWVE